MAGELPTTVELMDPHDVDDSLWDDFVERADGGDHVQSSGWGRLKARQGWESFRVAVTRDGAISAGAQVLVKRRPVIGGIGYVTRGPLVTGGGVDAVAVVIEELQRLASRLRIRHLIVQPARTHEWLAERLPSWGFVPSSLSVAPTATVLVDLTVDVHELWRRLSKSTRRHVRKGEQGGIAIREGGSDDLEVFHSLLQSTGERQGYTPHSLDYFEAMWREFHSRNHVRLFLAEYEEKAVSAHLVVPFGDLLLSKISAWSGDRSAPYPNETLEWHMIRWAKQNGFRNYDFEGLDRTAAEAILEDSDRPPRTADQFKLKFGGEVVLFPTAFDYFPSRVVASTYGRLYGVVTSDGWLHPSLGRLRTRQPRQKARQ